MFDNNSQLNPALGQEEKVTTPEEFVASLKERRAEAQAEKRKPQYANNMARLNPKKVVNEEIPTKNGMELTNGTTDADYEFLTELTQFANGKGRVVIESITMSLDSHEASKRGANKLEKHFFIQMQDSIYSEIETEAKVLVAKQVITTIKPKFRAARTKMYIEWVQPVKEIKRLPYHAKMPVHKPKKRQTKWEQLGLTEQELAQKRYSIKIAELPPEKLNKLVDFLDNL